MTPRTLLSLLLHAEKGLDVLRTAQDLGLLELLDAGPTTLAAICAHARTKPNRTYKLLDCLESMGLVLREPATDDRLATRYRSRAPLGEAFRAVLGPDSIERDRDRYDWRAIHGRLPAVLRGETSITSFAWPPETPEQVAGFEASMALGCAPIAEAFRQRTSEIFGPSARGRWLDVGGGDGTLASVLLAEHPALQADVFNLPAVRELVAARARAGRVEHRLGFVAGDFFAEELPSGYDVVSFVRVLHDWDEPRARALLAKGARALAPGGRLVLCEELRNAERLAEQFFWTYFLLGVDACESRLREVEFYLTALADLGFDEVRVLPGPFDVVVATRR